MKKFLLLFLLFPIMSHAQNCPTITSKINIIVSSSPIIYEYRYSSRQIETLFGQNKEQLKNFLKIGLMNGRVEFKIEPQYEIIKNNNFLATNYCAKAKQIDVKISMKPIIYVAKETQGLQCTFNQVIRHEETHYNIEAKALNTIKNSISAYVTATYNSYVYAQTPDELKNKISIKNKDTLNYLSTLHNQYTEPYHKQLDTPENYTKESNLCPDLEKAILFDRAK